MEDDLKECRAKRCKRRNILVETAQLYCECGARYKKPSWRTNDQIPLSLGAEGASMMHQREVKEAPKDGPILSQIQWVAYTGEEPWAYWQYLRDRNIKTWAAFHGSKQEYIKYLAEQVSPDNPFGIPEPYNWIIMSANPNTSGGAHYRVQPPPKPSDEFTCDEDVKGCPLLAGKNEVKARIEVPNRMFNAWVYLCKVFNTEWIAYLKGLKREDGAYEITDMYFPKQKANGAHVDAEDGEVVDGTIGAIHSHVAMSAYFSTEDEKHANHEIELVVNRRAEWDSAVRHPLECGRFTRIKAGLYLLGDPYEEALVNGLKGNLVEQTTTALSASSASSPSSRTSSGSLCGCFCTTCTATEHLGHCNLSSTCKEYITTLAAHFGN